MCLTKAATFIVFALATPATVRRGHQRYYKTINIHLSFVLLGTDALIQPHSTCQKIRIGLFTSVNIFDTTLLSRRVATLKMISLSYPDLKRGHRPLLPLHLLAKLAIFADVQPVGDWGPQHTLNKNPPFIFGVLVLW